MKTSSVPLRWCFPLPSVATSIALAGLMLGAGCGDDSVSSNDGSSGTSGATMGTGDGPSTVTDGPADSTGGTGPGTATGGPATDSATTGSTGTNNDSTGMEDHGDLLFIEVVPTNAVLEVDLNTPAVQVFEIRGHYEDGALVDLTSETTFQHSNPMIGVMNGENLEIPAFTDTFIGTTQITAMVDGQEGEAQLTLAAYAQTGAETDFFFVLPYEDPAGSEDKPLTFSTDIKELDVFINMDTTGSMGGPISNLQTSLNTTVIPNIQASIDDTWFGVGAYMDYPIAGFGTPGCFGGMGSPYDTDQPFILLQEMTSSAPDAQTAVTALANGGSPIGCGADGAESHIEALYQIATGDGLAGPAPTFVAPNMNGIGGAAFREGALPVIVSVTDNSTHDPGLPLCTGATDYESNASVFAVAATRADTHTALNDICARVVTVAVSNFNPGCGPLADGVDFAEATDSVIPPEAWDLAPGGRPAGCAVGQCCTGTNGMGVAPNMEGLCPLVYQVDFGGNGVGDSTTNGVIMLANYAPFSVTTAVSGLVTDIDGVPLPPGFTTADFIKSVVPLWHGPTPLPGVPNPILTPDAFENVVPNTPVTFNVEAYNDFIPQTDQARLFRATISVLADSCGDLGERDVFVLVPPEGLPPPG